jgi:hypothetical protein
MKSKKKKKVSIAKVDSLWALAVRLRANNHCEYCGDTSGLNSHHIFSRSNKSTRWDLNNGICLCVSHHVFGNFSAHKAPLEFAEWIKELRGEEWYRDLRFKAKMTVQKQDLSLLKVALEEVINNLSTKAKV